MLAEAHGWTPDQVDALDPAFIDELMLAKQARQDHQLLSMDSKDNPQLKREQNRRKADIARWRRGSG